MNRTKKYSLGYTPADKYTEVKPKEQTEAQTPTSYDQLVSLISMDSVLSKVVERDTIPDLHVLMFTKFRGRGIPGKEYTKEILFAYLELCAAKERELGWEESDPNEPTMGASKLFKKVIKKIGKTFDLQNYLDAAALEIEIADEKARKKKEKQSKMKRFFKNISSLLGSLSDLV